MNLDDDILTPRMKELRDTSDPGLPPSVSPRRQESIQRLEARLAQTQDTIMDLDRYLVQLRSVPNPCVRINVPKMTRRYLQSLKNRASLESEQIRRDLDTLRKATW